MIVLVVISMIAGSASFLLYQSRTGSGEIARDRFYDLAIEARELARQSDRPSYLIINSAEALLTDDRGAGSEQISGGLGKIDFRGLDQDLSISYKDDGEDEWVTSDRTRGALDMGLQRIGPMSAIIHSIFRGQWRCRLLDERPDCPYCLAE